ncbi:hypothetical protein I141_02982 [Pasteurella multocida P1933]|nr:hypothetical protein I141_02982 [Pasteurella multocida P1933]
MTHADGIAIKIASSKDSMDVARDIHSAKCSSGSVRTSRKKEKLSWLIRASTDPMTTSNKSSKGSSASFKLRLLFNR